MKTCEKCGYESEENKPMIINGEEKFLCFVCKNFAPPEEKLFDYLQEKLKWQDLETFRKYSRELRTTESMGKKAKQGKIMSRAAFGYKLENKELLIDEEKSLIVQKIFMDFLNEGASLNKLEQLRIN